MRERGAAFEGSFATKGMKRAGKRGWNGRRNRSSDRGKGRGRWVSIVVATGAGNASLGYPVTKLVRFVQRGPRYVGLSPLKMVQLKPHCSDAAALERDTRPSFASKTRKRIPCLSPRLLTITKVRPVLFFARYRNFVL